MPAWVRRELDEGGGFSEVIDGEGGKDGDDDVILAEGKI